MSSDHPPGAAAGGGHRFATTQWSLVVAAGQRGSADAEAALARLCTLYWYPVFAFVRRQVPSVDDAQDLTQGFFTRLIEKGDLSDADRSRGRFRTFLLTSCEHYLSNERDRSNTLKRGGGRAAIPIDVAAAEGRYQRALSHDQTPENLYDRQWCLTLLDCTLDSLRHDYAVNGDEHLFTRLRGFLTMDDQAGTHADAARDLEMTPGAVKVAVHRLRRRYRDALRRHVAETVESPQQVDDEMRFLLEILSRPHRHS
jgi:DNA-directed RNA polymerase specialized sigma24 family protein